MLRSTLRPGPKKTVLAVVAALVVATSAAACSGSESGTPLAGSGDAASVDELLLSGVGVIALGCGTSAAAGSGVVLGVSGQVVTVAHTVAGATSIRVVDAAGAEYPASVVAFEPDADLAVLHVDALTAPPLDVGPPRLGNGTLVRWSLDGGLSTRPVEITQRLAITIDDIYGSTSVRRSGLEFSGSVVVGDSGGPIVSAEGIVIGIVYARSSSRADTGFATDADEINKLLQAVGNESVDTGACL